MSIDTALLTLSATGLAASIRERRVSAAEVVDAHIAAVEAFNPRLNAVVSTRFDEARREARAADELAASTPAGELPPLHGVPFTVKESIWLTGMPNTSGLVSRRDHRAASDATAVARWRAAGAIPLGVTNVSEL
jgi:fatty acid amide hydrolase 2